MKLSKMINLLLIMTFSLGVSSNLEEVPEQEVNKTHEIAKSSFDYLVNDLDEEFVY